MNLPTVVCGDSLPERNFTPPFLVPPFIRSRSLTLLSAEPFVGKSALLMACAAAMRYRAPLLGQTPTFGRVLYLACDAPRWDYQALLTKIRRGIGAVPNPPPPHEPPSLAFVFSKVNILDPPEVVGTILDHLRPTVELLDDEGAPYDAAGARPSLLIIDTLRNIHTLDENDAGAMSVVMGKLREIADAGTAVVLAHHQAKNTLHAGGYSSRGSTVIPGSADIHILLRKASPGAPGAASVKASWVKGRGGDCPDSMVYLMSWDSETLIFSLPAATKSWTPAPDVAYSWNDLAGNYRMRGDQLTRHLAETGWVKGPDKLWRIS